MFICFNWLNEEEELLLLIVTQTKIRTKTDIKEMQLNNNKTVI